MQQSIRYKGLSLTPDEMAVENGALSLCGNLELHDGALRPAIIAGTPLPNKINTFDEGDTKLLYIHESGSYKHFIGMYLSGNSPDIRCYNSDGELKKSIVVFDAGVTIRSITSVGNTLILITSAGTYYALFQKDNDPEGDYEFLGEKPPFLELSFTLDFWDQALDYELGGITAETSNKGFREAFQQTNLTCGEAFIKVSSTTFKGGDKCVEIKADKQSEITDSIYALIHRTNNLIARNGLFYANFMIRYCYRMFDGSMIMHSAPLFMPTQVPNSYLVYCHNAFFPTSGITYAEAAKDTHHIIEKVEGAIGFDDTVDNVYYEDADHNKFSFSINKITFMYYPRALKLLYSLTGNIEVLKKWNEVIKSVDIFITPPITNIDTDEKINSLEIYPPSYYQINRGPVLEQWVRDNGKNSFITTVRFPTISQDAYNNKLCNTSAFYKVASLPVSDLQEQSYAYLPIDKTAVYNISLQEQMKDDYKTHNLLTANGGYVYNHRLNLFGITEKLFSGFSRRTMFPNAASLYYTKVKRTINKIVTVLNTTSGKKYVEQRSSSNEDYIQEYMIINLPKFYPDPRAEKMVIFTVDSNQTEIIYSFTLKECEELNGAMHMGDFQDNPSDYIISSFTYTVDDTVELPNKIYTSETDNAFYFPLNAINTVGIGTIQGIAATTRALSQGQFGQYPLMAFSTDGIWAMDVSAQGTYSSIHPISRDVCSNPLSITQLDQSVFFVTNRSANRVAESQIASMSDVLDGPFFNIVSHMGKFFNYFLDASSDSEETKLIKSQMRQLIDFSESPIDFFQRCQVIYDYKNSRIFCLDVSNRAKSASVDTVALCYSIRDQAWSTLLIKNVLTVLNSYPHPYIQFRDGSVICLDKGYDYSDDTQYHGIIVTRTLKFDEDGVPDSITGYLHSLTTDSVPLMWIYGSHDNQNWHYLGRCGGMKSSYMVSKSYRYFRIALYLKMKTMSQYFATRLEVIRRFGKF